MYWTLDCGVIILSGAFLLLLLLTFKPCTGLWRINYAVLQSLAHLEQCFGIWRFNLSGRFAATSASKRALNQRFNGLRRIDLATTQAMNSVPDFGIVILVCDLLCYAVLTVYRSEAYQLHSAPCYGQPAYEYCIWLPNMHRYLCFIF